MTSPLNRGRFCLELARLSASKHNEEAMLLWLARTTEAGYDFAYDVRTMPEFAGYDHDTRIAMLIQNAKAMRSRQIAAAGRGPVPALPADAPKAD